MPRPLSTGKWEIFAHKNWNLLLPCLSIFIAVPNRFATVMKTSGGTSLRKALAKSSKSIQRSLSIGTLAQDPCPLQTLLTRVAKSENFLSTRVWPAMVSTSDADISSSSYAVPSKRIPGTSSPSALVTIVYWYSGKCSSIQYAFTWPDACPSKRAVACGWYWLDVALLSSAGSSNGAGAAFGRDFNMTSAVWTRIVALLDAAGSPSPAAFGGSSLGGSANVPEGIVLMSM